ncbi:hypothetical protein M8C21_017005, partial [Ambrosia artemisiifolia]
VESQHADLKRYLPSTNSNLTRIVGYIDDVVVKQESHIKKCFEESRNKTRNNHKRLAFHDELSLSVSIHALNLIENKFYRLQTLRSFDATCGCQLYTSCGLVCACHLERYINKGHKIAPDSLDQFWRKLDFRAAKITNEDIDLEEELN